MILSLPICVQIPEIRKLDSKPSQVLQEQQNLLEALSNSNNFAELVISLRYLYDPTEESFDQRLKIYLSINHPHGDTRKVQSALNILTNGSLSDFYNFQPINSQPNLMSQLDWVNVICEIVKYEEFIENHGYYIPYLFEGNPDNDMLSLCRQLNQMKEKLMIEITLQTCKNSEKESIFELLEKVVKRINRDTSSYQNTYLSVTKLDVVRDIYNKYLKYYRTTNINLFKYSIKVLAQTSDTGNIPLIVGSLMQNSLKDGTYGKKYRELQLERGSEKFNSSLSATQKVELSTDVEWEDWQGDFGQQLLKDISYSDSSSNAPIRLPETEPIRADNNFLPSTGEVVKSSNSWSLGEYFNGSSDSTSTSANQEYLKLLHRLVTPQEISGFFRIVIAGDDGIPGMPQEQLRFIKPTAEEIFEKYKHRITEHEFIVGVDDNNYPVYSSWNEVPHRLIAGTSRSGKTNFIYWVIFQFLYKNPISKVYVVDFNQEFKVLKKALLKEKKIDIELETEENNCDIFLKQIETDEFKKRQSLVFDEIGVRNIHKLDKSVLEEYGINGHRILLIVDEAASISNLASNIKNPVEKRLQEYARMGAKVGIHVIYCTQTPTRTVVSNQITTQLGERVAFHLSRDTGDSVLEKSLLDAAIKIPEGKRGQGRAIWQVGEGHYKPVNTPEITIPEDGIPISATIWDKLCSKL